jgi:integrase
MSETTMRRRLPLPKGVPRTLRFQSVAFEVLALGDGRVAFAYYDGSRRVVVKRRTIEALRPEAERIATAILNADTAALELTAEQRRIAGAAFSSLAPFGLQLDAIAREAAEAAQILGPRFSIVEMARAFRANRRDCPGSATILAELLEELREDQRSAKYITGLAAALAPFVARHPDLRAAGEPDIRAWLRTRQNRAGEPVGPRRRDNLRDAVVRLFNFAAGKKYLAREVAEAVENIAQISHGPGEVSTFAPQEIGLLLEHVSAHWMPWMSIAAFAGLRTSEILRLNWKAIKLDETDDAGAGKAVIAISRMVAKKVRVSRLAPIAPNLAELLLPYRGRVGPLYPHKSWRTIEDQLQDEIERLEKLTGLEWKNNVLRHSFGSHRLAIVKNIAQVAYEMGNSPQKVRENYNDPKSETEAKTYFSIAKPDHEKIVTMPLALHFAS